MGSQLRWLERTPDKREVDGSIPFEPTNLYTIIYRIKHIEKYIEEKIGKLDIQIVVKNQRIQLNRLIIEIMLNILIINNENKVKLQRAQGEQLGTKSRRRT